MGRSCQKDLLDWLFAHVFKEEPYILLIYYLLYFLYFTILRASEEFPKTNTGISSTRVGRFPERLCAASSARLMWKGNLWNLPHFSSLVRESKKKVFHFSPCGISDLEFFLGITRLREYPYTFLKRMKNCSMIRLPGLIRIRVADP